MTSAPPHPSPAVALPNPPDGRRRTGRCFGAELDGTTLRVMEVVDDVVVSFTVFRSETVGRTVRQFLATNPRGPITVAWHHPATRTELLEFADVPVNARGAALADALDEVGLLRPDSVWSFRITDERDGTVRGVSAVVDVHPLREAWDAFESTDAALVPASLLYSQNGLFLGLRNDSVDLALIADGKPMAVRYLSCGGLNSVYERLGPDPARAFERVAAVVRGAAQNDLEAVGIVHAYVVELGVQITRTTDFWTRQGLTIPSDIHAHGPGFLLPNLAGTLMDAALFLKPVAPSVASLDTVSRIERPVGYSALLAGLVDQDEQPLLGLRDPEIVERNRRRLQREHARKRLIVGAGTAAALVLASFGLILQADGQVSEAEDRKADLETQLASYAPALVLQTLGGVADATLAQTLQNELDLPKLMDALARTLPAGGQLQAVRMGRPADGGLRLNLEVRLRGRQEAVSPFLEALSKMGAEKVWLSNVPPPSKDAMGDEFVNASVTALLPAGHTYVLERPILKARNR